MSSFIERPRAFCALGGALSTLEALPDTITILHSASGCAASVAWGQNGASALQVGGYCGGLAVPGSNVGETEVVFGGAERLTEQIRTTLEIMEGKLFVVITGCVTEIIGDDVKAACAEFADGEKPVAYAATGGFKGNSYLGYDLVLSALARQFVKKTAQKEKNRVNIFGVVPYMDCFWRGNLTGIRKSLELIGVKANTFFTLEDSLADLENAAAAELNIVVSDLYGHETAAIFEEEHGIPSIVAPFPIGPSATAEFLRAAANALRPETDVEAVIEKQTKRYWRAMEPLVDCYHDADLQRRAIVVGDVNYGAATAGFLIKDLGWLPELVQFTDPLSPETEETLRKRILANPFGIEPKIVFDSAASEAIRYINEIYPKKELDMYADTFAPGIVVGSSLERDLALKLGAAHLSVSFPISNRAVVSRGYTGFDGGLTLTEDLLSAVVANR
jgi:nitrogenase molybdenum-iron protein beta chain